MKSKRFTNSLYCIALSFVKYLSVVFSALLFISAFLYTCYAEDMTTQLVLKKVDFILWSVPAGGIALGIGFLITHFVLKKASRIRILLYLVLAWCLILGLVLVVFGKTVPAADSMSVYSIAESLALGDTSVIHPTESYLSYYPQQVGLCTYYEIIIRIWHLLGLDLPAYHIIKVLNVLFACLIILFQCKTLRLLFHNNKAECCYLLLAAGCLPLIFYTSFIYGEIPSFALFTMGLFAFVRFVKKQVRHPILWAAGSLACFALSVMLRKNTLILITAVLLTAFFSWLKTCRHTLLLYVIICALCTTLILPAIQSYYEHRAGNLLSLGVPAVSYLAMGMQESSRANGWYNGFNFNTYAESGMDRDITAAMSKDAISERMDYFRQNPGYAFGFYRDKFFSQWTDGTYACRQATLATFGGRSAFFREVYEGRYSGFLIGFCNIYQNLLYLGTFLFTLFKAMYKKKTTVSDYDLLHYLGIIGAFGGFLFHMFWEANSRYIFSYSLLLIPAAAAGFSQMLTFLNLRFSKAPAAVPH